MRENHIMLAGYTRRKKERFELMRLQAYITAKFGNSNPKKFPKTIEQFMPSPFDEEKPKAKRDPLAILEENRRMQEMAKNKKKATPQFLENLKNLNNSG